MIKLIFGIAFIIIETLMAIAFLAVIWWFIRYMIIPRMFPKHFCQVCGKWQTIEIRQMKAKDKTPFCDRECWSEAPATDPIIEEVFTNP